MIESVGYTVDGVVWMKLIMDIDGKKSVGVLTMTPEFTRDVTTKLIDAANKAEASLAKGVVQ